MTQRLFRIILAFLLAAPLLLAQDSQSNDSQAANIGGAWQVSWQGRGGSEQAAMQIQQEGSKLTGTFQGFGGASPVSGNVAGNNVSFNVQIQGRPITLAFTGTIDGDSMSGTFKPQGGSGGPGGAEGSQSWSGVRQQGNSGQSGAKESRDQNEQ